LFIIIVLIISSCSHYNLLPEPSFNGYIFRYFEKNARSVNIIGSFNKWDIDSLPLTKKSNGLWEITIKLPPGIYLYSFIIDKKRYVEPQDALFYLEDGFGNRNGVIEVRENGGVFAPEK